MNTNVRKITIILLLIILLISPLKVEAEYKVNLSFFAKGGTSSSGNIDIINDVIFVKDGINTSVSYNSNQTIKHINSLDKKTTFTLKKGNLSQTKNREWCSYNFIKDKDICFSNSKEYKASDIVKALDIEQSSSIEVFLEANYEKPVSVTGVNLNKKTITIKEGENYKQTPIIKPSNASNTDVTWKSSNPTIAKVDEKGIINGVKKGSATIIVTTKDGNKTATCKVNVISAIVKVNSVKLNKTSTKIEIGKSENVFVTINPTTATNKNVTYSSSNPKIAKVENGKITGVSQGTATITVTTKDGNKKASIKVTVPSKVVKVTKVTAKKTSTKIEKGKSEKIGYVISPSNASNKQVTWKSSNTSIAKADSNGKITGVKEGTATITLQTSDGNKKASIKVTVTKKQPTYVTIIYNINGAELEILHDKNITIKDNIVNYNEKPLTTVIKYNLETGIYGLLDYNNNGFLNIDKKMHMILPNKEWNTKPDGSGKTYSQEKVYKASDFCNASQNNCTVTLYANWKRAYPMKLNVATFNIGFFACGSSAFCNANKDTIAQLIKNNHLQHIGLQEARTTDYFTSDEAKARSNEIIKSIGRQGGVQYSYINAPKNVNAMLNEMNILYQASTPLVKCSNIEPYNEPRSLEKIVVNNYYNVSYYNTHLQYDNYSKGISCTEPQIKQIAEIISKDPNPVILTGDFNYPYRDLYEKYLKPIGFIIAAHDTNFEGKGVDSYNDVVYVIPKHHIEVFSSETVNTYQKLSDHNLVIARIGIK